MTIHKGFHKKSDKARAAIWRNWCLRQLKYHGAFVRGALPPGAAKLYDYFELKAKDAIDMAWKAGGEIKAWGPKGRPVAPRGRRAP